MISMADSDPPGWPDPALVIIFRIVLRNSRARVSSARMSAVIDDSSGTVSVGSARFLSQAGVTLPGSNSTIRAVRPLNGQPEEIRGVPQGSVQSVDRVIGLLDALGQAGRPLNVRELSTQVHLPRPTIYRLMQTLASHGLVPPAGGGFVLGPRILALAAQRLEQGELRAVGHGRPRGARDQTAETVHLAVLEQGHVVYIDKIESPGPLRMASAVGKIMPAHCTALGKAMLACLPADTARRILHAYGMPRRTANTITDVPRLTE